MIEKSQQRMGELDCTIVAREGLERPRSVAVLCHGFGAPGTDLVALAGELISTNEALSKTVYIFPAAPMTIEPMFDARARWMIDVEKLQRLMELGQTRELSNESPVELPRCREMIEEVIQVAMDRFKLPSEKIIIG